MEVILYKNNGRNRIKNVDMSSEYDVKKKESSTLKIQSFQSNIVRL